MFLYDTKSSGGLSVNSESTAFRLYALLETKLSKAGGKLPCTMDAMISYASRGRREINYLDLINLDNLSFAESFYLLCFNIQPSESFRTEWMERIRTLPKDEFQEKFVNSFVQRHDYVSNQVRLYNCTVLNVLRDSGLDRPQRVPLLLRVYKKTRFIFNILPPRVRETLKNRFRRYFFYR
jgi:hypothetical protein